MKIFLSSTYQDLVAHRKAAAEALERLGQHAGRMEVFGARPEEPLTACLAEIDGCDLFVGIYAHRYGFVPWEAATSITEAELDHAARSNKPIFCFVVDDAHPWPPTMIEEGNGKLRLKMLKKRIGAGVVRDVFTTPEDLAVKVATSVGRYLSQKALQLEVGSKEAGGKRDLIVSKYWDIGPLTLRAILKSPRCDIGDAYPTGRDGLHFVFHLFNQGELQSKLDFVVHAIEVETISYQFIELDFLQHGAGATGVRHGYKAEIQPALRRYKSYLRGARATR